VARPVSSLFPAAGSPLGSPGTAGVSVESLASSEPCTEEVGTPPEERTPRYETAAVAVVVVVVVVVVGQMGESCCGQNHDTLTLVRWKRPNI